MADTLGAPSAIQVMAAQPQTPADNTPVPVSTPKSADAFMNPAPEAEQGGGFMDKPTANGFSPAPDAENKPPQSPQPQKGKDPATDSGHQGADTYNKMLDAGAPADQVQAWKAKTKQSMLDAGAPPDQVDQYWGDVKAPTTAMETTAANPGVANATPEEKARLASGSLDSLAAGLQMSVSGLAVRRAQPNVVMGDTSSWWDKLLYQGAETVGDLPVSIPAMFGGAAAGAAVGSAVPGVGTAIGAAAGGGAAFNAVPEAIRGTYLTYLQHPDGPKNFHDFLQEYGPVAASTAKATVLGAVGSLAGIPAGKIGAAVASGTAKVGVGALGSSVVGEAANLATQTTAQATAQAALDGRMPNQDDFISAGTMIAGMHVAGKGISAVKGAVQRPVFSRPAEQASANVATIYKATGVPPVEAARMASGDYAIEGEVLGPTSSKGFVNTPALDAYRKAEPEPYVYKDEEFPGNGKSNAWGEGIRFVLKSEGGKTVDTGGVTNFGISAKGNPELSAEQIDNLTKDQAANIYKTKYWNAIGADDLPEQMKVAAFDAAVNQGVGWTKAALKESGGDISRFMDLRRQHYGNLVAEDPEKYGKYAKGWENRLENLEGYLKLPHPEAIVDAKLGMTGFNIDHASPDPGPEVRVSNLTPHDWSDYLNEGKVVPGMAEKVLSDGTRVPDPEEIGSHLKAFGREAGIQFHVQEEPSFEESTKATKGYQSTEAVGPQYVGYNGEKVGGHVIIGGDPEENLQRWMGVSRSAILYHEIGHALHHSELNDTRLYPGASDDAIREEMIATSKRFRPKLWDQQPDYNMKNDELFADNIAQYLSHPADRESAMPLFKAQFGDKLDKYVDIVNRTLPVHDKGGWDFAPEFEGDKGNGQGGKPPAKPPGPGPQATPPGKPPRVPNLRMKKSMDTISDEFHDQIGGLEKKGIPDWLNPKVFWRGMHGVLSSASAVDKVADMDKSKEATFEGMLRDTYRSGNRALLMARKGWVDPITKTMYKVGPDTGTGTHHPEADASIEKAMRQVKEDGGNYKDFITYRLAKNTINRAAKGNDTGFDLQDAMDFASDKGNQARYERGLDTLQSVNHGLLRYLRDSDMLSDEHMETLRQSEPNYININRIIDPHWTPPASRLGSAFSIRNRVKSLGAGGKSMIMDPTSNDWSNMVAKVKSADVNRARRWITDYASKDPRIAEALRLSYKGGVKVSDEEGKQMLGTLHDSNGTQINMEEAMKDPTVQTGLAMRKFSGLRSKGDFLVFRKGVPEMWHTDNADIADLFNAEPGTPDDPIQTFMRKALGLVYKGIFAAPVQAVRTIGHVSIENSVFSNDGSFRAPFVDLFHGMVSSITKDVDWERYMANGGLTHFVNDPKGGPLNEMVMKTFHDSSALDKLSNRMRNPLDGFMNTLNLLETASKIGRMKHLESKGFSTGEAVNVAMRGMDPQEPLINPTLNNWGKLTAFFRVGIKDVTQVTRSLSEDPLPTMLKIMGMATATAALWSLNKVADQNLPPDQRSDQIPEWVRSTSWYTPPILGHRIYLPMPYVGGAFFGNGVRMILDDMFGSPQNHVNVGEAAGEILSRISPPTPMVQFVTPLIENEANYSFFLHRNLVPQSLQDASGNGYMQYSPSTSMAARALSRVMGSPGANIMNVSPIYIDNLARGWLGTTFYNGLRAIGNVATSHAEPDWGKAISTNPFLGAFVHQSNPWEVASINKFYDLTGAVLSTERAATLAKQRGDELSASDAARNTLMSGGMTTMYSRVRQARKIASHMYQVVSAIGDTPTISEQDAVAGAKGMTASDKQTRIKDIMTQMINMTNAINPDLEKAMK